MPKSDYGDFDYSAKMSELEAIIKDLQDTDTSIDKALESHVKGVDLAVELEEYLNKAEIVIRRHTEDK